MPSGDVPFRERGTVYTFHATSEGRKIENLGLRSHPELKEDGRFHDINDAILKISALVKGRGTFIYFGDLVHVSRRELFDKCNFSLRVEDRILDFLAYAGYCLDDDKYPADLFEEAAAPPVQQMPATDQAQECKIIRFPRELARRPRPLIL